LFCLLEQLASLADDGNGDPALPTGHPFLNVQSAVYWSATSVADLHGFAGLVNIGSGFVGSNGKSFSLHAQWPGL